ncbi:type I secretion system permease/ATPase [Azospirillum agricola]|uniref:type I secretion system permease/ATPase n=1 Tax=Azospirillum agricola TaxID=1720247 RepID=UPI000A0F3587|nr:type I secretion system permease/ATPase [Azospirillum agricola]SMH30663.1 ATP-binding cassette, subfamily C [Azospirillum lipoferum]
MPPPAPSTEKTARQAAAVPGPAAIVARCRAPLLWVAGFSLLVNLLMLTSSLYMMQVYDRVLPSGSLSTLLFLSLIAAGALALLGALDYLRVRTLGVLGDWMERRLGPPMLERMVDGALLGQGQRAEILRDLGTVRGVLGNGLTFLFDAPWVPVYLALLYALHPVLGHVAMASALLLFALALINDRVTRASLGEAAAASTRALATAETAMRNAEAVDAMHLLPGLTRRWERDHARALDLQERAHRRGTALLNLTKFLRQMVQVAMLGAGAWLVVRHEMGAGSMMAASLVVGRALAPVEQAIGGWRQVSAGRDAWRRLTAFFARPMRRSAGLPLPSPAGRLTVQTVAFRIGDRGRPLLNNVSFEARAGEALAIVGPSAAGKSTLARLLVGLHPPLGGAVRLDGADLFQWRRDDVGRHIGYLPQDVELFAGTVAENIARLGEPAPEAVVEAARLADCHAMILRLPNGYDTEVGDGGAFLSGGQRQRIALARALYGAPKLVVLDEPNASLDAEGEQALNRAIAALKERGACVIVIGHRPGTLAQVDRMVALRDGRVEAFGPRAEVLEALKRRTLQSVPGGAVPGGAAPARGAQAGAAHSPGGQPFMVQAPTLQMGE